MMSPRDYHWLAPTQRMIGLLILALLVSFSPLATAFHDDGDEPQHLDLYSAEDDEVQLFDHVVYLTQEESEELFSYVSEQDETEPGSPLLTLYLERLPLSLEGLNSSNILAAAVTPPKSLHHELWDDTLRQPNVKERLAWDGLLHHVNALENTDDGWQLRLERAVLADAIKQGTLVIEASTMIRSREEMFGLEPHIYQEGDHYRKVSLHTADMHCTPGRFQVDTVENIELPYGINADIAYSAVLHMTYALTFDNGQVEHAELDADICQAGSLKLRTANEVDKEWLLWKGRSRPKVFWVGWPPLPIVARAGGSLTYGLEAGAGFEQQEPVLVKHHLQRKASRSHGSWSLTGPELTPPAVYVPDPSLYIDVETTSKLVPQLEVILYGLAGPYIQVAGAATLGWHSDPSGPSLRAGLTLQAGIQQAHPIISLCQQGECEKTLGNCEWEWDFDQLAFNGPGCEWMERRE